MKHVTYINAGAGSGKTYKLTHILAELIGSGKVQPEQVIMTTFTNRAADDMREKAKSVLYEQGLIDEASRLDQAMIGTIHSVANALIKKYWFRLGLSPDMGVMSDEDTTFYISQSLAFIARPDELRLLHRWAESFDRKTEGGKGKAVQIDYNYWKEDLKRVIAYTTNYEIGNYDRSLNESLTFLRQFIDPTVDLNFTDAELREIIAEHRAFLGTQRDTPTNQGRLTTLDELRRTIARRNIQWYKRLLGVLGALKKCGPLAAAARVRLAGLWRSPLVYDEQKAYVHLIFSLAERWREQYLEFKRERNMLDYNDMEKYMRDLLAADDVAADVAGDYRYLLVDEFQDCSPIQVKIFDRLSELMEHSYWVGDYKQAIYGFRGSDITLVKAVVDRIASGNDGCDTCTLDTSWRSVPDVVNVCNKVFCHTFKGVLTPDEITLKAHRGPEAATAPALRYWQLCGEETPGMARPGLALHIADLVEKGVKPSDIAVLARKNKDLDDLATELAETYGLPVSRESAGIAELPVTQLVMALLAIVESGRDSLAKASVAFLTQPGFDTKHIIESKLLHDSGGGKASEFLNDVPMVKRLLAMREQLRQQSVAALVETLIIELDLYNEAKKLDNPVVGIAALKTVCAAARAYEEHCLQMNLAASVTGFIAYITDQNPSGTGETDGVQLWTYHGAKGLEWKYVILTSLADGERDDAKLIKQSIYGVHFDYAATPSAADPFPEVFIRVLPYVYGGGNTKTPDEISQRVLGSDLFTRVSIHEQMELNRLLYVGMTRARDVLVLALEKEKDPLRWFKDVGLNIAATEPQTDLLGVGYNFADGTLLNADLNRDLLYHRADERLLSHRVPYSGAACTAGEKYLSPSTLHIKGGVTSHWNIGARMPIGRLAGKQMNDVGDCLHQIYCGIERFGGDEYIRALVDSYGVGSFLTDVPAIRTAWENLCRWMETTFGKCVEVGHEVPFIHHRDGHVYTGSIDLVWQTDGGTVVVDFKTCPMGDAAILDRASEHYAGWYAGQLDAYAAALTAAGHRVTHRLVYYPVSGLLVELAAAATTPNGNVHDDLNFDKIRQASLATVETPDGEQYTLRILSNAEDTLVGGCEHVALMCGGEVKNVPLNVFLDAVDSNRHFVRVDTTRFVMRVMPDAEWRALFDALPSRVMRSPKTYLLRWNPCISSFKLERYREALKKYPNGFGMDWSVYEWEEAHEGDYYYMLRTGDDHAGLVWRGVFTSDPYIDDDWAGTDKKRHYVRMDCVDCVPADGMPTVTIEMLEQALPDIDWRCGHSGQLLTAEQADALDDLWDQHR